MATLKNGLSRRSFLTLGGVAALGGLFRRDKTLICPFKIA